MTETAADARARAIAEAPLEAVSLRPGFFRGTARSLGDIWSHRELLSLLVKREVKSRYKDSTLGIVWSLFRPLAQLLIYYFAIGQVLGAARSTPNFAIFVFTGLTIWGLFNEVVSSSTAAITANAGLIKKVYVPREYFPLSAVGSALFNFAVQTLILIGAIVVFAHFPWGPDLLLAPAAIGMLLVFSTAVGLVLSAANVYLRDTQHFIEVAMLLLFWASPIVYPFSFVHDALKGNWIEQIYLANPVTTAVLAMQKALWAGGIPTGSPEPLFPGDLIPRLLLTLGVSVVLIWIAQRVFSRLQGNFAQEL